MSFSDWQTTIDNTAEPSQRMLSLSQSSSTFRSSRSSSPRFLERVLSSRRKSTDLSIIDIKGQLGLNLLHSPSDPLIDFVFVHGLGGGSTKTWCLTEDPSLFWPKEWLPREPAFRNARFHSFGYDADWMARKGSSTLNIHDFGQSLLESLRNSPSIRESRTNRVIFVAHSMGGLLIKQAYILARQDPSCADLAKRIEAMVFIATPHRGSNLASILNSILRASTSHDSRAYITNLERSSEMLALLNESFRHYAQDLILYSFYESQQTNLRIRSEIIVPRDSAIMGYPGERSAVLNADHRHVCKFESPSDPNYIVLRNALESISGSIMRQESSVNSQKTWREIQQIESYLGLPGRPDDDLKDLEESRIAGSCEWFGERENFQEWANSDSAPARRVYWVSAKPATGKSVLSGYVINTLSSLNLDCSYYFFRHGDKEKSSVSSLLRSIILQMGLTSLAARQKLLSMIERGDRYDKDDAKAVWRKLVVPIISLVNSFQTQHWIIDALDECSDFDALFPMISSLEQNVPIKFFFTSRKTSEIVQKFVDLQGSANGIAVTAEEISFEDTRADIALYLESNRSKLHVGSDTERDRFLMRIMEKSGGCFLWVRLVLQELASAWTVSQVERVLEEVPQNMEPLYSRALSQISSKPKDARDLARAILIWTVCAVRPLTLQELRVALKFELEDDVRDLESAIASLCAQLVHVDHTGRVLMVHLTARSFLVDRKLESEFGIVEKAGHLRLAEICLRYLCSDEMKPPRARKAKRVQFRQTQRSPFISYACSSFAEHVRQTTSKNGILSVLLQNFLQSNVLSWIEYVASTRNLSVLTRTANSIKTYLQRHISSSSPLGEFVYIVESWVVDLHRLVTKFGINLLASPSAIYWLIPPLCPASSAIASSCGSYSKGIVVKGLSDTGWDDRLASIDSHSKQAYSVACGEVFFAIGYSQGNVSLYHNTTCQEWKVLEHGGPVRHLRFDSSSAKLVSAGRRDIRVWDIESGHIMWDFITPHDILALAICDKDKAIMAATREHSVHTWSLQSGGEVDKTNWTESVPFYDEGDFRRPPLGAAFSPDESLIAVVYRGRPICLYDMEEDDLHGLIGRESDPAVLALGTNTSPASLVFNTNEEIPLLAVAYEDGDLCLFDYEDLKLLKLLEANALVVACSPDGQILATGNSAGAVQLLEFETLQVLYQVNAIAYGIRCLAFSTDNQCVLDVRGTQCNVWEPSVLSGLSRKDEGSTDAAPLEPVIKGISDGELEITNITPDASGNHFFVGKSDGTVCVYDTETGTQRRMLYRHTHRISLTSMDWGSRESIIATSDTAGRFIVCALKPDRETGWVLSAKLVDACANSAILGILLDPTNELLLVTTAESTTVWNVVDNAQVRNKRSTHNTSSLWINHPTHDDHRILLSPDAASVVDWKTSSIVISSDRLQLPDGLLLDHCQRVKKALAFSDNRLVAVEVAELYAQRSASQILLLKSDAFGNDEIIGFGPLPGLHGLGKEEVIHLIGARGSKIIFVNKHRWVCSLDVGQTECKSYSRHFPIPSDWQSQQRVLRMAVTSKGDILFVRMDEVAVIKRGLDFEESIPLSDFS
ncbi:hypothetical protein AJ80_06688 [Polytolypa hystricis UAMH7299]|uniref:GPI inositol-deacylase n=1 Tax=Polytolypa hystricis (strain UAMH7299) TaxID=1447883 RepID=A0A2B7XVK3_POLH7|nr:hypothetical protein AJ80_06688 [Polytolypa hystricis UAMH7299]